MTYLTRIIIATLILIGAIAMTIMLSWNLWITTRSIDAQSDVASSIYMLEKMSTADIQEVKRLQALELEQQLIDLCMAEEAGRVPPTWFHHYLSEVIAQDSQLVALIPASIWLLHEKMLEKYPELSQSD